MKHTILYGLGVIISSAQLFAQSVLPSYWNMNDVSTPPTGWETKQDVANFNLIYTNTGLYKSAPQSLRLDGTGEYCQVHFTGKPDSVTFYFRYTGSGSFQGAFDVLESENGTDWTVIKSYLNSEVPSSINTRQAVKLNIASRYVRLVFSTKVSGWNIALDDVTVTPAPPGTGPELRVFYDTKEQVSGSEVFLGNGSSFDISLTNRSKKSKLVIADVEKLGLDTGYFQITNAFPIEIDTSATAILHLQAFVLGNDGSKKATVRILSNDTNNNPFLLQLYAIKGALASEPLAQPSNLSVIENKAWRVKLNFDASQAEHYLVLFKKGSITESPIDGETYEKGAYIGGARITHVGEAKEILFDKIEAGTSYQIKIFAFNGSSGFENYLLVNAPEITVQTPGSNPGNYYNNLDPTLASFVGELKSKIRPHFQVYYSNYGNTIVENFEAYDTTSGKRVLRCYYSNFAHVYTPPIRFDTMSREHTYPFSWMGESSQDSANYSDLFILFPVHQNQVNAIRSNYPLGEVKDIIFKFREGTIGTDSAGKTVYEPRDEAKGMAARAMFYICAAYHRDGKPFTIPSSVNSQIQDQNILKKWNKDYPPSAREIARNEYIYSIQNNRNPFIDFPNWACYIDFSNLSHVSNGDCNATGGGINTQYMEKLSLKIYPNPSNSGYHIDLKPFGDKANIFVYGYDGQLIYQENYQGNQAFISAENWSSGSYLLVIKNGNKEGYSTLIRN